jgi:multidrug efflux system outer membrane protein
MMLHGAKRQVMVSLLLFVGLAGCNLAPEFMLPKTDLPEGWKEVSAEDNSPIQDGAWKLVDADSKEAFAKGEWWRMFNDVQLNALLAEAMKNNPTLEATRERLILAQAQEDKAESELYPDITAGAGMSRQRQSPANPNIPIGEAQKPFTTARAGLDIDYGLDLFGRSRNLVEAALMRSVEQEALLKATQLALQSQIASTYVTVLRTKQQQVLLEEIQKLDEETLALTRIRFEAGEVSDLDVAAVEAVRAQHASERLAVTEQRGLSEHLLATLTGVSPASLTAPQCTENCMLPTAPEIPAGLPSSLLERRPDIAAAAHELAARNAEIGLARAAFFPAIDLTGSFGYESTSLNSLFNWSHRTWLLGPISGTAVTLPLFTGGRNEANLLIARASYREQVATYRAAVLNAMREVEDALIQLRTAREGQDSSKQALDASTRVVRIAEAQYAIGYSGKLALLESKRQHLQARSMEISSDAQRINAAITLVQALGGSWAQDKATSAAQ